MNQKQTNWQPLLTQAEDQLSDLPEVLATLKQAWLTYAPAHPPFSTPSPHSPTTTSHFFFFN